MKIIKFSALWCPACLIMNNRINKIANKYNIDIIEYDYDIDEDKKEEYNINNILPVIILQKEGKEVKRLIGELSENKLEQEISDLL